MQALVYAIVTDLALQLFYPVGRGPRRAERGHLNVAKTCSNNITAITEDY